KGFQRGHVLANSSGYQKCHGLDGAYSGESGWQKLL
ncbi:MAG: hypothetical protein ACI814_001231, partial [Mariniblastus sp.]